MCSPRKWDQPLWIIKSCTQESNNKNLPVSEVTVLRHHYKLNSLLFKRKRLHITQKQASQSLNDLIAFFSWSQQWRTSSRWQGIMGKEGHSLLTSLSTKFLVNKNDTHFPGLCRDQVSSLMRTTPGKRSPLGTQCQLLPPSAPGPLFFVLYPHFSRWLSPLSWLLLTNVEKYWTNQGPNMYVKHCLFPALDTCEEKTANMWREPTFTINRIPASTGWGRAASWRPAVTLCIPLYPRHPSYPLSDWRDVQKESLPLSLHPNYAKEATIHQVGLQN